MVAVKSDEPLKILFVDDEENILKSLTRLFMDEEYEILTASSGAAGLAVLGDNPDVALIVSDQRMPQMTGVEFLEKARVLAPEAVRIILTGYADGQSAIDAINRAAANRYISKPWDDGELVTMVKDATCLFSLKRENERLVELTKRQNEELKDLNENLEDKVREQTKEIRENFFGFVRMFADLMSLYDPQLGGHVKRVAIFSMELAESMEMDDADVELLEISALLHDIGLIGIPREVLKRVESGLLSNASEEKFVKKNPVTTQALLAHIDILMQAGLIIRGHMERFDGKGYPDGLKGEEIHIGARILAVCKAYDRLVYKKQKLDDGPAIEYLRNCAGKDFDPQVVATFIGCRQGKEAEQAFRRSFGEEVAGKGVAKKPKEDYFGYFETNAETTQIPLTALRHGMVMAEDLKNVYGKVLITMGSRLTPTLVNKVQSYKESELIDEVVTRIFKD